MFKSHRFFLCLVWSFIASLCAATSARAQSAQAYVSARNGVDAGNCTNASPCRTVSYAITQVQHFGQILIVDSGDYDSSVQIDRSVTVAAAPGVIAVFSAAINLGAIFSISSGPALCTRAGVCHTLVLRNLTFDGQNVTQDGVRAGGMNLTVEDCHFSRFRMGIYMNGAGTLNIKRSSFRDAETGIHIAPVGTNKSVTAVVEGSQFDVMRFAGFNADANGDNSVRVAILDSRFDRSGTVGIRSSTALGGGIQFNVERCHIAHTANGVISVNGSSVVRVSNSVIVNNTTGVLSAAGGVLLTRRNNTVEGNNVNGAFTGIFIGQ